MAKICEGCGEECNVVTVDNGIGAYEYWGSCGVHHSYEKASDCCETDFFEGDTKVISRRLHIAKKAAVGRNSAKIAVGQPYVVIVHRTYRKDGPSWVRQEKLPLTLKDGSKGKLWCYGAYSYRKVNGVLVYNYEGLEYALDKQAVRVA